jgi:hypothetical protein
MQSVPITSNAKSLNAAWRDVLDTTLNYLAFQSFDSIDEDYFRNVAWKPKINKFIIAWLSMQKLNAEYVGRGSKRGSYNI